MTKSGRRPENFPSLVDDVIRFLITITTKSTCATGPLCDYKLALQSTIVYEIGRLRADYPGGNQDSQPVCTEVDS